MYCIKCEKNTVSPMDMDGNHINEVEELWRVEERNGKTLNINNKMTNGGIIQIISAGYGSKHDTDRFIIAICDDCISKEMEKGTLLYYDNYMHHGIIEDSERDKRDKSKKIYQRRKNLDNLKY